ncbi:MAG: phosphoribosyltransferase [Bacteroides sp.]|nr:phosphoribosyltransferase [Bacteroides sp.]
MKTILTYIFKHKYFKEVTDNYTKAITEYQTAFDVWSEYNSCPQNDTFENKEYISSNISEIMEVSSWMKIFNEIKTSQKDGLIWLFNEKGRKNIPNIMGYQEYKLVAENLQKIREYQNYSDTYNRLISTTKEAAERYLGCSKQKHTHEEKKNLALHKSEIHGIDLVLKTAHFCEANYKLAWEAFSKGRKFSDIHLDELKTVNDESFKSKNNFLVQYSEDSELIKLIMSDRLLPIDSFSKESIKQEEEILATLSSRSIDKIEVLESNVSLSDSKELKRAILDSVLYGNKCSFSDSFTIPQFYDLRKSFDSNGVSFDDAVRKMKDNDNVIRAFNKEHTGKSIVYIEDYLKVMTESCDLYKYVEEYRYQKAKRAECKILQFNYHIGFEALFGSKNLDTCVFTDIITILSNEILIKSKDSELREQERIRRELERKRQEEERKRQEEEQKRQELRNLQSCVSSWSQPSKSTVNCFSLYYYYPTTCQWEASEEEWNIRNLIWDFKAKPHDHQSDAEIILRHTNSVNKVLPLLKEVLCHYFGNNVSKLTFVPILASTKLVSERRYKDISEQLTEELQMNNGYPHITITRDGISKNDPANTVGYSIQPEISFDSSFFRGKYVIIFDDVITSGKSMERFKRFLESVGATVIGGLSIGNTQHERQSSNPIEQISIS